MKIAKYLGHGRGRVSCLMEDGTVLKIPVNRNGILQSRSERDRYNSGKFKYLADIVRYDERNDFLYMEYVEDKSEYFIDYERDGIYCDLYDHAELTKVPCSCDGMCEQCIHNVLANNIPYNIAEILEWKPKDRFQIGIAKDGTYKYFDYSEPINTEGDFLFRDSYLPVLLQFLEEEPDMRLDAYLQAHGCENGTDEDSVLLKSKFKRRAWSDWCHRHHAKEAL